DVAAATAFDDDGKRYQRINLTVLRSVILGDRWEGDVNLSGNDVTVTTTRSGPGSDGGPRPPRIIKAERPSAASRLHLLHCAATRHPILEGAEIVDAFVAQILERLAGERRAATGGAIDDQRLVFVEILVMRRRLRVGAEFE